MRKCAITGTYHQHHQHLIHAISALRIYALTLLSRERSGGYSRDVFLSQRQINRFTRSLSLSSERDHRHKDRIPTLVSSAYRSGDRDVGLNTHQRSDIAYIVFYDADTVLRVKSNNKFPAGVSAPA